MVGCIELYVMDGLNVIGDMTTNKEGTETCNTDDCQNNYTPYNINHDVYCVTCASDKGVDVAQRR